MDRLIKFPVLHQVEQISKATSLLPFSDDFNRANGDLANGWEYNPGKWTISSNSAIVNPATTGSELVVNGDMELDSDWISEGTPVLNARSNEQAHGGTFSRKIISDSFDDGMMQTLAPLTLGDWYRISGWVRTTTAPNTLSVRLSGVQSSLSVIVFSANTWQEIRHSGRCIATSNIVRSGVFTGTQYYDDMSVKKIILSDMFCSRDLERSDVDISVPVTMTQGNSAGIVLCLDSITSPSNFLIAYHTGYDAFLVKCVNGVYTEVIKSVGGYPYVAGAPIRVVKNGTTVSLYYNDKILVPNQATVSDAGIINNTRHGLFSTSNLTAQESFTAV